MVCRLRGLADAMPPPMPLTCMRLQLRCASLRPGASGLSTSSKASIPRCRQESLTSLASSIRPRRPTRGFTSTAPKGTSAARANGEERRPRRDRRLATLTIALLGVALLSAATDVGNPFGRKRNGVLNGESFVPFKVISTEQTSPTTFILTVSAPALHEADNAALIDAAWAHGLWSVEIKQPQLQIARNYTPLPPAPHAAGDTAAAAHNLRFLVRRYDGGEMSTYLSRLQPGDEVWLRGPHLGFDVAARLGACGERVVFLAGGTGVAPALQVARHLLRLSSARRGEGEESRLSMEIIWASRSRADCAGCPRLFPRRDSGRGFWGWLPASAAGGTASSAGDQDPEGLEHPVVRELRELQAAFRSLGHELELRCVADDEAGAICGADVTRAIEGSLTALPPTTVGVPAERASCYYHSQKLLQDSTHESDAGLKGQDVAGKTASECACGGKGANGKNLLMISGPDGFISAYVGPKIWADGAERQGPVGGLVCKLMQKNPEAWKDWLILKQ